MARLHLIDGTYELYRAHYSRRPGHEVAGRDLKATVGLAATLIGLLHDAAEAVTHVAIAFDNPIRSIRNDWYAGYKSDEGVPPELRAQFDLAEDAARALGIVVWSMDRYEADDALGTAAVRFAGAAEQVRLLTPDKDLGQVIRGQQVVLVDRMRQRVIDEPELLKLRGLRPASVPDWLSLVGDAADGFPGLAGFGDKTAGALLRAFGHLEQIPLDARGAAVPQAGHADRGRAAGRELRAARVPRRAARSLRGLVRAGREHRVAQPPDALERDLTRSAA